ncbi:hypothetical protein PMAYCL1PPCAC_13861, partial [Pristionchus mayeri]
FQLALVTWKQALREHMATSIVGGVLDLIEQERQGIAITSSLVKGVVDCLVELGIDEVVDSNSAESTKAVNPKLRVYKQLFEEKFIRTTEAFYVCESSDFLLGNSIPEYMKKVEKRLIEEKDRCEKYLHRSSLQPLERKCEEVLISVKLDLFQNEFPVLLENDKDEVTMTSS